MVPYIYCSRCCHTHVKGPRALAANCQGIRPCTPHMFHVPWLSICQSTCVPGYNYAIEPYVACCTRASRIIKTGLPSYPTCFRICVLVLLIAGMRFRMLAATRSSNELSPNTHAKHDNNSTGSFYFNTCRSVLNLPGARWRIHVASHALRHWRCPNL